MVKNENDYEKRKLLIEAAKKEFLEKGYNKASLRNICANAGMTTGALYFFFSNKEDLYESIVNVNNRVLIQYSMQSAKETFKEIREFESNPKKILALTVANKLSTEVVLIIDET